MGEIVRPTLLVPTHVAEELERERAEKEIARLRRPRLPFRLRGLPCGCAICQAGRRAKIAKLKERLPRRNRNRLADDLRKLGGLRG